MDNKLNNKYKIAEVQICTFEFLKNGLFKPNLNDYSSTRLCVIDKENGIAIDVGHECKYDYLETISMIYFINGASKKIKENKRAAFNAYLFLGFNNQEDAERTKDIIKKLENGYEFLDGNDLYSNEEYLELVTKERDERLKLRTAPVKQKRFGRKK